MNNLPFEELSHSLSKSVSYDTSTRRVYSGYPILHPEHTGCSAQCDTGDVVLVNRSGKNGCVAIGNVGGTDTSCELPKGAIKIGGAIVGAVSPPGMAGMGEYCIAIGPGAANKDAKPNAICVGVNSASLSAGRDSINLGADSGVRGGDSSLSLGPRAGIDSQRGSVNIGSHVPGIVDGAGILAGECSINIAPQAGASAGPYSIACGVAAGQSGATGAISIGSYIPGNFDAPGNHAGMCSVNIAPAAGAGCGPYSISCGVAAGNSAATGSINIGSRVAVSEAAGIRSGECSVNLAPGAGIDGGAHSFSCGMGAGKNCQRGSVNIGSYVPSVMDAAGFQAGQWSVNIASNAGKQSGFQSVSCGVSAGEACSAYSINLGARSGKNSAKDAISCGTQSSATGSRATVLGCYSSGGGTSATVVGETSKGEGERSVILGTGNTAKSYGVCLGTNCNAVDYSIAINAEGIPLQSVGRGLYIRPIRNSSSGTTGAIPLYYNETTCEVFAAAPPAPAPPPPPPPDPEPELRSASKFVEGGLVPVTGTGTWTSFPVPCVCTFTLNKKRRVQASFSVEIDTTYTDAITVDSAYESISFGLLIDSSVHPDPKRVTTIQMVGRQIIGSVVIPSKCAYMDFEQGQHTIELVFTNTDLRLPAASSYARTSHRASVHASWIALSTDTEVYDSGRV